MGRVASSPGALKAVDEVSQRSAIISPCQTNTSSTHSPKVSPLFVAGRSHEQRRFQATLRGAPHLPANVRLTGLRGVGKTVLLKEFEKLAQSELGWSTSRIQIPKGAVRIHGTEIPRVPQ